MFKSVCSYLFLLVFFSITSFGQTASLDSCEASQNHAFKKDYKAAIKASVVCLQSSPNPENVYANIGFYYEQLNDFDNAILNLNKAINIKPPSQQLLIVRALYYARRKDFSSALSNINDAIAKNENVKYAYLEQGNIYKMAGKTNQAQASYNEALKHDANFDEAESALGILEYEKRDYEKAVQHFNRAEANANYFSSLYYYRALIHKHNGDFNWAMKDVNITILANINIVNENALLLRAELFAYNRKNDSARMDFEKVKKTNPLNKNLNFVMELIRRAEMKKNVKENIFISKNVVVSNLYSRAKQLLFERRLNEAFLKIDDAIKTEPSNILLYILSGEILFHLLEAEHKDVIEDKTASFYFEKNEYWNLGISDLNTAIKISPKNATAYYWRGAFYIIAKKYKQGAEDWNMSLSLNPNDEDVKAGLDDLRKKMQNN